MHTHFHPNKYQNHRFPCFSFSAYERHNFRTIYQNRHICIIIFNNLHSTHHTMFTLRIALNRWNDSFQGRKSIQIMLSWAFYMKGGSSIQCVCLTKTDNRWTHACSKIVFITFYFISFSLRFSPRNLINKTMSDVRAKGR